MNWKWMVGGLLLVAPLVGGCAPNESGPSFGNLMSNFADDWTSARSIDRAEVDLSRGNIKAVEAAGRALDKRIQLGSRSSFNTALAWMNARSFDGGQTELAAQYAQSAIDRDLLRRDSETSYRAALAFLPSQTAKWRKLDPQLLNGLGYFLADHGRDRADFERAVKLTALALERSPSTTPADRYSRAQLAGDSHAWALFRLGRTAEALKAQAEVMSTLGLGSDKYGPPPADIAYHWGAICRVAGRESSARDAFQYALTQKPSPELREILEINLEGELV